MLRRLIPAWNYPISKLGDIEATPLVLNGVMYVTGVNSVYALNAATGGSRLLRAGRDLHTCSSLADPRAGLAAIR